MIKAIIKRTLRVPVEKVGVGDSKNIARQLDVALLGNGFKLARALMEYLSGTPPAYVKTLSNDILGAVKELVGDHVKHNVYFKNFPEGVPDTNEFWTSCLIDALYTPGAREKALTTIAEKGVINLLDLPKYGKYLHSYEEMLAAHEPLLSMCNRKITVIHLGRSLQEEVSDLYNSLAGRGVPLNEEDRKLLEVLAELCVDEPQPEKFPVRENKAIINKIRLNLLKDILADTPTDVLRLACALSEGDVTLAKVTKFKSLKRPVRRALLKALNTVVEASPEKLSDVNQYSERWKRLGSNLHPFEYKGLKYAQDVFHVANGEKKAPSLAAQAEQALSSGNVSRAIDILSIAPGMLFRRLDHLLRVSSTKELSRLVDAVETVIQKVSGRVILSLQEHLTNRVGFPLPTRVFANSKGTAWVEAEKREPLKEKTFSKLSGIFNSAITERIPVFENLLIDPAVNMLAIPISDKNKASGFKIMPRGSLLPVDAKILRFFIHWHQHYERTDYDLSAMMLDENFDNATWLSWTHLRYGSGDRGRGYNLWASEDSGKEPDSDMLGYHSGDIVDAPNGASEFIDIDLARVNYKYIIPTIQFYGGEVFSKAKESFFGFMSRTKEEMGKPFEASTVKMKSEIRGNNNVAMPLVFIKGDKGWVAKWLHLYLKGMPAGNMVEGNTKASEMLTRSMIEHKFLGMGYLVEAFTKKAKGWGWYKKGMELKEPVTYIGIEVPEGLPEGSRTFTLANLHELVPA